jgi:glycerate-2-kinase
MALPAEGVSLDDKIAVTRTLLKEGASIGEINTVRKHLSAVKGGRLGVAGRARVLTLAISDVIGDDLSVIGSGPTVGDPTTFADALAVLEGIDGARSAWPARVQRHLRRGIEGLVEDTPAPDDERLAGHEARVIGSRHDAMAGARREAEARGYRTVVLHEPVAGEARSAGVDLLDRALALAGASSHPVCVIASGETTVYVRGDGLGGRNQELVLGAVEHLATLGIDAMLASVGTDGVDGPTSAAGAVADSTTLSRARAGSLPQPAACLRKNDAYRFFAASGGLITTGPTGTNVGDVQIVLIGRSQTSPATTHGL